MEEDGTLGMVLISEFVRYDNAGGWLLALSEGETDWKYADNDKALTFECTVRRGTLGAVRLDRDMPCMSNGEEASFLLEPVPVEALVYDENARLTVELELEIRQHAQC